MEIDVPSPLFPIPSTNNITNCTLTYSNSLIDNSNIIENFENLEPRVLIKRKPSRNITLLKLKTIKLPNIFEFDPRKPVRSKVKSIHENREESGLSNRSFKRLSSFTDRIQRRNESKENSVKDLTGLSPFRSLILKRKGKEKKAREDGIKLSSLTPLLKLIC